MRRLLGVFLTLFGAVAAWAAAPVTAPPKGLKVAPEDVGILFGSIGADPTSIFQTYSIFYGAEGAKPTGWMSWSSGKLLGTKPTFIEGQDQIAVFFVRLPPGKYSIAKVEFREYPDTFSSRVPFSIPFTVEKGKATYLGRFLGREELRNPKGMFRFATGGYFEVHDERARDFEALKGMVPESGSMEVRSGVPDPDALGLPYFRRLGNQSEAEQIDRG